MSWMKRAQASGPPTSGSEQPPPYSASQNPYANQQNIYQNYTTSAPTNPQQYWQIQTPQQYDNANKLYQHNNQSLTIPQTGYHPNYSLFNQNQPAQQQNYMQNQQNVDSWQDNWDWGWDESAKQIPNSTQQTSAVMSNFMPQQQTYNNANVIEESFTSNDTWNWSTNEKKDDSHVATGISEESGKVVEQQEFNNQASCLDSNVHSESVLDRTTINQPAQSISSEIQVKTLNDRDVIKEKMPNLALGKRIHLDNLTPQWSIESQMSQESSDGPPVQSECTYRSENPSRNSNKSSPGLNTDSFNYVPSNTDDITSQDHGISKNTRGDTVNKYDNFHRDEPEIQNNPEDLITSLKEMNLTNRENVTPDSVHSTENTKHDPQESISNSTANVAPAISSASMPPPNNFPPVPSSQNPFKHSGVFSHKGIVKCSTPNVPPVSQPGISTFPKDISDISSSNNLTSPSVINKLSQQRNIGTSYYQTANLETTPDNSERPDHPQMSNFRSMPMPQTVPENLEVAPKNDRNEYLQTAHLSSGDYGENTDFTREAPPLGLRRMVVGQQEGEYGQTLNLSSDEPPPGLSRMVPGQQNESDNTYSQPDDDYLGRHIDGQTTDATSRNPYRQADGQPIHNNYMSNATSRNSERRPIGLDRMVPGEPSSEDYSRGQQYQNTNYSSSSEHRIVTGVDYDYPPMAQECNPSEIREQNVDGSDYMEHSARGIPRNIAGARDAAVEAPVDYNLHAAPIVPDLDQTRELTVEGENLQDLSVISSVELSFSRDQPLDGADMTIADLGIDRKTDMSDSIDMPIISSRRQSLNRTNTSGEDSERDKSFKASPKRDRDKHKSSREKDLRHSREERKYEKDSDRRSGRDRDERDRRIEKERRDKDRDRRDYKDEIGSPESRRYRRINRSHRYETEDTDYYSDRERERRRYREGSYTSSKPPRPDDKDRRYREDKDRNRRYATIERERRYEPDSERYGSSRRRSDRDRGREDIDRKYDDRKYRDIDPDRKYGNLRREKEERRRVGEREIGEDERDEGRVDERARRRHRRDRHYDPYYDGYGAAYSDPYMLQRQQQQTFQYYEQLRLSNPAAYMEIYKKLMAGHPLPPAGPLIASGAGLDPSRGASYLEGYGGTGYEVRGEERGSVHSGRSSANGLTGKETPRARYYGAYRGATADAGSARDACSLRTDLSDRDFTTDASLNLQLEESLRSERMTPLKFATAHVKGSLSSRHLVVVRASYGRALDGRPAAVHVLRLSAALADDPQARELDAYPGPLLTGVTHKKSVIEYCEAHVRNAERRAGHDLFGYVLIWELLALLLRQNGTIVGSDIAELLMKNAREYEHRSHIEQPCESGSRGSAASSCASRPEPRSLRDLDDESASAPGPFAAPFASVSAPPPGFIEATAEEPERGDAAHAIDNSTEKIDRLRELLIYGNRQQAIEWAMNNELWGHALHLAAWSDRRTRAAVVARFVAAQPPSDPLHTLYTALVGRQPPVATCAADARWADWRPHLAVLLANPSSKPEHDKRTITQLGDSLMSRGLLYSAQFCYLTAGVEWGRHPMAPLAPVSSSPPYTTQPPRLTLLLAPTHTTRLQQFASNRAIFATEIYEYARSLHDPDYVISELQVYKLVVASRLADCGRDGRASAYAEAAARAVSRAPQLYSPRFIAQLAEFADKLKYHEEGVQEAAVLDEEGAESEASPRHMRWLHELQALAHAHSHAPTPTHHPVPMQEPGTMVTPETAPAPVPLYLTPEQTTAQHQQPLQQLPPETVNYAGDQLTATAVTAAAAPQSEQGYDYGTQYYTHSAEEGVPYAVHDWGRAEPAAPPAPPPDLGEQSNPYAYRQEDEARPRITMPGASGGGVQAELFRDYDVSPGHNPDSAPGFVSDATHAQERDTDSPSERGQSKKEGSSKRKEDSAKGGNGKSGWLGGILNKLSLRPPNQMILPDDKNPRIVWDDENKRWMDLDGDGDEDAAPPPPPPVAHAAPLNTGGPTAAPTANIFKMQKSRHIKKSYVDVFNPSGAPMRPLPPAAEVLGPASAAPVSPPTYFVPTSTVPQ